MHPNNLHKSRYDLQALVQINARLAPYVKVNSHGIETIDFHDRQAVIALNQSLLKKHYGINNWNIPDGYLCPPIPGRSDYLHYISDFLITGKIKPRGHHIRMLDIGVGANCIYPLIAYKLFGWSVLGTDIDTIALRNAQKLIDENNLSEYISLKHQKNKNYIIKGIISEGDVFDVVVCNPPFYTSASEAKQSNSRKNKNLSKEKSKSSKAVNLNFGGQSNELWCEGGEMAFIANLIKESRVYGRSAYWYTSLVSKASHLPKIQAMLNSEKPTETRIVEMSQGQKKSRFIAWTYLQEKTRKIWEEVRWKNR